MDEPPVFSNNLNPFRPPSLSLDPEELRRQPERIQHPDFHQRREQLIRQLSSLWSNRSTKYDWSTKYDRVRARLYDQWYQCFPSTLGRRFDIFLILLAKHECQDHRSDYWSEWFDYVENELKEVQCPPDKYFNWVVMIYHWITELVQETPKFNRLVEQADVKATLEKADWSIGNEESIIMDKILHHYNYNDEDIDYLPRPNRILTYSFETCNLQLRLNGGALVIPDSDPSTNWELYGERHILLEKIFLGLRFDSVHLSGHSVEKKTEKKSLIVIMLGNILFRERRSEKKPESTASDYRDSRFVLVCEIQRNGRPGDLYIVRNLTQAHVSNIEKKKVDDPFFNFCGTSAFFTVARVDRPARSSATASSSVTPLSPNRLAEDDSEQIQLTVISRSAPEIVETALCSPDLWPIDGGPPVGMYPTRID